MDALLRLSRGIDRLNDAIGRAAAWLCVLMVFLGAFNAVARYLGRFAGRDLSSNAYLEGQWYLFSLLFLLGAAWTLRQDRHVRVDVLYGRLPRRARIWIDLLGTLVFLLPFCVFALWVSWPSVRNSIAAWELSPDPGGLPRWPIKAAILVAFALLALQGVSEGIKRLALLRGRKLDEDGGKPEEGGPAGWAEGA